MHVIDHVDERPSRSPLCDTPAVQIEEERELDDRWIVGLRGSPVESITVNEYNVVMTFGGGTVLTIEGRAELVRKDQPVVSFNDDDTATSSDVVGSLTGSRVLSGVVFKTGGLRLVFDTGARLRVPFDPRHEAWQLTGPSGRMWVSLPGGDLGTFPPERT
jgi:hypothetical protein